MDPYQNKEYVLRDDETIVSKTDLHGNITYVNKDFVRISGFSEDELLGAPQNIVRHPDMPKEAFKDFWQTLKSGKAWTGLVKNRCKNGDYYWVEAHAAPIIKEGAVVGYTSVRVKPARSEVRMAEQAYKQIRDGDTRLVIREGAVAKAGLFGLKSTKPFKELSIRSRLLLWTLFMAMVFFANTIIAWVVTSGIVTDPQLSQTLVKISQFSMVTSAIVSLVGGAALYFKVISPLAYAQAVIGKMASGDLSGRIDAHGDNEISDLMQSLRKLQINVKLLLGQILSLIHI